MIIEFIKTCIRRMLRHNLSYILGPGIKQNYQFEYQVGNIDMAPTATAVLGLEPSPWWQGKIMTEAFVQQ